MEKLIATLIVAFGGSLGAVARFWVREYLPTITSTEFPFSTMLVNVTGCFLSGVVYMWLETSGQSWSSDKVLFFFVGFLGAFTTFSAFALDSLVLFQQQQMFKLFVNIGGNCLLCLICVFVGAMVGARIGAH
ncbi:MAG: fluoride efflux transporter CrcB [Kangiellaceae bacterium]